jgi:hypothetical protein
MQIRERRPVEGDDARIREIVAAYGVYVERIGRRPAPMNDDYAARIRQRQAFVARITPSSESSC